MNMPPEKNEESPEPVVDARLISVPHPPYAKYEFGQGIQGVSKEDAEWQNAYAKIGLELDEARKENNQVKFQRAKNKYQVLMQKVPTTQDKWVRRNPMQLDWNVGSKEVGDIALDKGPVKDVIGEIPLK
jgi:hypothetical protein